MVADHPATRENCLFTCGFSYSRIVPGLPGTTLSCPADTGKHRPATAGCPEWSRRPDTVHAPTDAAVVRHRHRCRPAGPGLHLSCYDSFALSAGRHSRRTAVSDMAASELLRHAHPRAGMLTVAARSGSGGISARVTNGSSGADMRRASSRPIERSRASDAVINCAPERDLLRR